MVRRTSSNEKKAVVKKEETSLPAVYDYGEHSGAGFEGTSREDFVVPFIYLLQAISPMVAERDDAKAGMLVNTATGELFPAEEGKGDGIAFIPCYRQHLYVEWKPREAGGGFVAQHATDSDIVRHCRETQAFAEFKTPANNDLIETFYVYGLLVKPDGLIDQVIIAFTSTKVKVYKQFMTRADTIRIKTPSGGLVKPPIFAHRYRVTSVSQKNTQGTFFNLRVNFDGDNAEAARLAPTDPIYQAAVQFYELAKDGMLKVDTDSLKQESSTEGSSDIPF